MKKHLFSSVILAAGQGSRMKSNIPKVLHHVGGQSLIDHLLATLKEMNCKDITLVTAPSMEETRNHFPKIHHAIQKKAKGTADALLSAEKNFRDQDVLVLYGDTPLVQSSTLQRALEARQEAQIVVLGMRPKDPAQYGRIFSNDTGCINRIVEYKEATPSERENDLCNSGMMLIGKEALPLLKKINDQNANKEFYLTDLVQLANDHGLKTQVIEAPFSELQGINTRADLAEVEHSFQQRKRQKMMELGVTLLDPSTVYFSFDTKIDPDSYIEPNVFFGLGVLLAENVHIRANSYIEGATIGSGSVIGPFARIRPETNIEPCVKVGNFVEIKKSTLEKGSKVSHLSYMGDTHLGKDVNVGAGAITANYDGFNKYKTKIEAGASIGVNVSLVAPLTIGKNAIVGAGSVVTEDIPSDTLTLARSPQHNIKGAAKRFRDKRTKK
jgi:bifunctional UDP-N-acetylglucosamine pyrophosphorylase/glucosamine-1-phosphate N-acetyltransferase